MNSKIGLGVAWSKDPTASRDGGRAIISQALYMPALVAIRFNPDLKANMTPGAGAHAFALLSGRGERPGGGHSCAPKLTDLYECSEAPEILRC